MISLRSWFRMLIAVTLVPILALCVIYKFVPKWENLKDPLGSPSQLSDEIIYSASQFDAITSRLDPKHQRLSESIQVLRTVDTNLAKLTGDAGRLPGLAITLNQSTSAVVDITAVLPSKIELLTKRSNTTGPAVTGLSNSIDGVTTQLELINTRLQTVGTSLATLGPRANGIARTLSHIEEEAAHVQELGPLLALLGPLVNGPKHPAPPDNPRASSTTTQTAAPAQPAPGQRPGEGPIG